MRPQKPIFTITRGYTEELWELTTSCWDEKPTERPNVDEVLEALRIAAEQREPQNGGSSQSDWSQTLYAESDLHALYEPEDEHVTMGASPPSPVTKTLVHAATPSPSTPPSTTKNEKSSGHIFVTPDEKKKTPIPKGLSREEDNRQIPVTPRREEMRPVFVGQPSQEGPKQGSLGAPLPPKSTSISLSRKEEVEGPASIRRTPATSEKDTKQTSVSLSEKVEQIQPRVQEVETMSEKGRSCLQDLVEVCEEYGVLPMSCIIQESTVRKHSALPVFSGSFSCVWTGECGENGGAVAIKVLQQRTSRAQRIKSVRSFQHTVFTRT